MDKIINALFSANVEVIIILIQDYVNRQAKYFFLIGKNLATGIFFMMNFNAL